MENYRENHRSWRPDITFIVIEGADAQVGGISKLINSRGDRLVVRQRRSRIFCWHRLFY